MPLTNYSLEKSVAPGMTRLRSAQLPDVTSQFRERKDWVSTYILNSIFVGIASDTRVGLFLLRRAEAALSEYSMAAETITLFVQAGSTSPSVYFRALHHIEMAIMMAYQAIQALQQNYNERLFEKGDGSLLQQANQVYNDIRHTKLSELPDGWLHRLQVTDNGVKTQNGHLSFAELAELLRSLARIACAISTNRKPE